MTALITADLHLDDSPKNQYRWDILEWLEKAATKRNCDLIAVLGDFTDAKDKHSSKIVNRVVDHLYGSANQWLFLKGNHDYVDADTPFFGFLDKLPNVRWITKATSLKLPIGRDYAKVALLPATKDYDEEWRSILKGYNHIFDYCLMHGTFAGTLSETGYELPGIPKDYFNMRNIGRVYAGDVHVPGWICDRIESVGSPYRVRFGDTFNPRVIHIGEKEIKDLHPNMLMRHVVEVRTPDDLHKFEEIVTGDQVKIRVRLKRNQLPEWKLLRKKIYNEAVQLGWEIYGIEPTKLTPVRRRLDEPEEIKTGELASARDQVVAFGERHNLKQKSVDYGIQFLPAA